jgi:hypothetical protein
MADTPKPAPNHEIETDGAIIRVKIGGEPVLYYNKHMNVLLVSGSKKYIECLREMAAETPQDGSGHFRILIPELGLNIKIVGAVVVDTLGSRLNGTFYFND